MTITIPATPAPPTLDPVRFLELEITRECALRCAHCYSNSGPAAGTGEMSMADWMSVIEQAAAHPAIATVQFIGGEPTDHPAFVELAEYALLLGLQVAVFTNLYRVGERLWGLFSRDGVKLSTSWYTADRAQHDQITGQTGAWEATWANIAAARRLGIELKVGMVEVLVDQDLTGGAEMLTMLGITDITRDHARPVGRAAIDTNGRLMPCVLGRGFDAGNVTQTPLVELLNGEAWHRIVAAIPRRPGAAHACNPGSDGSPAETEACNPAYDDD